MQKFLIFQFLFVSGHDGATKIFLFFCSCQVTAGPINIPFFVQVRSQRGQQILQFLFVSGHGGANKYSNFYLCQVTAGPKNIVYASRVPPRRLREQTLHCGVWVRSRKEVKAATVGVLVVRPGELYAVAEKY